MNFMPDRQPASNADHHRRWLRFSLRSLLLIVLLVATYCAGWVSHRAFHNRNLQENIEAAIREIETKNAELEMNQLGTTVITGKSKSDVEAVASAIEDVHTAAGQ